MMFEILLILATVIIFCAPIAPLLRPYCAPIAPRPPAPAGFLLPWVLSLRQIHVRIYA